jgi:hypothetical protein
MGNRVVFPAIWGHQLWWKPVGGDRRAVIPRRPHPAALSSHRGSFIRLAVCDLGALDVIGGGYYGNDDFDLVENTPHPHHAPTPPCTKAMMFPHVPPPPGPPCGCGGPLTYVDESLYLNVSQCVSICLNVSQCVSMCLNVSQCVSMCLNLSQCVSKCFSQRDTSN